MSNQNFGTPTAVKEVNTSILAKKLLPSLQKKNLNPSAQEFKKKNEKIKYRPKCSKKKFSLEIIYDFLRKLLSDTILHLKNSATKNT